MGEIQAAQQGASAHLGGLQHGYRLSWLGMPVPLGLTCILLSKAKALRGEMHRLALFRKQAVL